MGVPVGSGTAAQRGRQLAITAEEGLAIVVYTAEPGSASAERLQLLASLAASEYDPAVLWQQDSAL